ncbi:SDR family oxidoreductase [Proteiniborus sp. MB09-C3]|uniref:SDR family oxidoreductase n=1 Tax=Proteiniborus sp. MB09-C3 TaxID=3050072 RepID=UPI0025565BA0|nr:SDR family oxidoreductase [Proteiniborus sp. MB09-C3]WIV13439.1 SDR family oxidoreductase [Proteiniborus sp. MB09-C3]
MELFRLDGKVALVTGATKGLGAGMAVALAEAGAKIIGVGTSSTENTKKRVEAVDSEFYGIQADLSKPESISHIIKEAYSAYGRIDILVNNAGVLHLSDTESHSDEAWDFIIQVNSKAVFQLCREVGAHMLEQDYGKIINISSIHGLGGGYKVASYTASKHAVIGITKALANEWADRGINVNAIAPGYMVTDNTFNLRQNREKTDEITARIPKKRWGTPDDLKGPVVFLASEASDYVNGHVLVVDGGLTNA